MPAQAAYVSVKGGRLEVKNASDYPVGDDEIKVEVRAVAINPADHLIADTGMFVDNWPVVLGSDCAGKVVEIGKSVTTFTVGDRVAANPASVFAFAGNKAGAFQDFTVLPAVRAFKIPNEWTYEDASVMPLATATAAIGMFAEDRLNLEYPKVQKAPWNGKIFLVWGGSSSVGTCAVQMAAHSGYEVYATASKKNFDMVKSLGASKVFDYTDVDVIANIVNAIKGREGDYAGAYSATQEGQGLPPAVQVAAQLGLSDSFVATSNPRVPQEGLPAGVRVAGNIATQCWTATPPAFAAHPEIGQAILQKWLPEAMAAGTIKVSPPARVVGHGLDAIDAAVELSRTKKVSGEKLVVTL